MHELSSEMTPENPTQDVLAQPRTAVLNLNALRIFIFVRLNIVRNCEKLDITVQENVGRSQWQRARIRT